MIRLNGNGAATPRVLYTNPDIEAIEPADWSPDGKWIAVHLRKDQTVQIGLISPTDGSLRVLKSVNWLVSTNKMFFSPDSKWLAFDLPQKERSEDRDVFVMATDGSREIPAVVHAANDTVVGWSANGKHLLFSSNRAGSMGIWSVPFEGRKPQDAPELISNVNVRRPLGVTRSGVLYVAVMTGTSNLYTASIDFGSGKVIAPPVLAVQRFFGSNILSDWSPDGKYLSFKSSREILAIRSIETGETRELRVPELGYYWVPRWAPDGRSFAASGETIQGGSLSPDGRYVVLLAGDGSAKRPVLMAIPIQQGKPHQELLRLDDAPANRCQSVDAGQPRHHFFEGNGDLAASARKRAT